MASVQVLLAQIGATEDALPARFWHYLTPAERARAARYRRATDRVQFIAARGILHDALRQDFGIDDARIEAEASTKPVLSAARLPPGLDFNLSHTDGLVACAIGLNMSVGIDVECQDRKAGAASIIATNFAPAEQQTAVGDFLRLWTLKEAVTKAAGLGLSLPLQNFACALDPPRLLQTTDALGPINTWHLHAWTETAHHAALAIRSQSAPVVQVERINLDTG